jgi:hypothetical protein
MPSARILAFIAASIRSDDVTAATGDWTDPTLALPVAQATKTIRKANTAGKNRPWVEGQCIVICFAEGRIRGGGSDTVKSATTCPAARISVKPEIQRDFCRRRIAAIRG